MAYSNLGTITTKNGGSDYNWMYRNYNANQSFKPNLANTDRVNSFQWYGKTSGTVNVYLKDSSGTTLGSTTTNSSSVGWHTFSFGYITVSPTSTYYIVFVPTIGVELRMYYVNRQNTYSDGTAYVGTYSSIGGTDRGYDYALKITCYNYYTIPSVSSSAASSVGETLATVGGNVTSSGGSSVTERGVYWGTSAGSQPNKVASGSGTGVFTANISGLDGGTMYHYKAYAKNAAGTDYGSVRTFTTTSSVPSVTTGGVSDIDTTIATVEGNVTDDHGANVTERGVCYNTTGTPTTAGDKVATGSGEGVFESDLTGLTPDEHYYARAYAINSNGTTYGSEVEFDTLSAIPTVTTTDSASGRTTTTVTVEGNVVSDNGSAITERGFVYSTELNPTVSDGKAIVTGTTGAMTTEITGLGSCTDYHFRAYATNSEGIGYGADYEFTTLPSNPTSLVATVQGKDRIFLEWESGTDGKYIVIRGQEDSPPANINSGTLVYNSARETGVSTAHTGLDDSSHWYYRVWTASTLDWSKAYSEHYADANKTTTASFSNPANAQTDDTNYATIPTNDGNLYCQVSKDDGVSWGAKKELTFTSSITTQSFGLGVAELWGATWVGSDLNDENFLVKITGGSDGKSYQIYSTFGFNITDELFLTGVQVQVKAAYDSVNTLLYFVKVNGYYGTSNLPIGEGSLAYNSTLDRPTYYDGNEWTPMGGGSKVTVADQADTTPVFGDLWIDTTGS